MLFGGLSFILVGTGCKLEQISDNNQLVEKREKTAFQTGQPWRPTMDNRADVAIVYGIGGNASDKQTIGFEERVRSWRERGYTIHFMTGSAWGEYQDYFTGAWDGKLIWMRDKLPEKEILFGMVTWSHILFRLIILSVI